MVTWDSSLSNFSLFTITVIFTQTLQLRLLTRTPPGCVWCQALLRLKVSIRKQTGRGDTRDPFLITVFCQVGTTGWGGTYIPTWGQIYFLFIFFFFSVCFDSVGPSETDRALNTAQRLMGKERRARDRLRWSWFIWQASAHSPTQRLRTGEWRPLQTEQQVSVAAMREREGFRLQLGRPSMKLVIEVLFLLELLFQSE